MVETITPVVHGGRQRWIGILALHVLGATAAAALVGAMAGGAGEALGAPWGIAGTWAVAGLAAIYLLREAGAPIPLPQLGRQVPESWRRTMPHGLASILYGAMLGVGYLTHLGHGTWLVVGAVATTGGRPLLGAAIAAPFGLARGAALLVSARARRPDDASRLIDRLEALSKTGVERTVNAVVLGGVAFAVAAGSVGLGRVAAWSLALVFAWAAGSKLLLPRRWDRTLAGHDLPRSLRPLAQVGIPLLELAIPGLVLAGDPGAAAVSALVLLGVFSLALVRARRIRGNAVPCGCFGGSGSRDARVLLARNAALGGLALLAFGAPRGSTAAGDVPLPASGEMLPAILTLGGAVLALLLIRRSVEMLGRR